MARNILEHGLSPGELINVNVPAIPVGDDAEFEVTRLGKRIYQDQLIARKDPRGIPYFWIGGPPPSGLAVEGTDFHAVVNQRIAVTPIHLDLTGRRLLKRLRTWDWTLPSDVAGPAGAAAGPEPGVRTETAAAAGIEAAEIDAASVAEAEAGAATNDDLAEAERDGVERPERTTKSSPGPLSAVRSADGPHARPVQRRFTMDDRSNMSGDTGLGATTSGEAASPDPAAALAGLGPALQSAGGIDGVMDKLRGAGLGDKVDSWVSTQPNQQVEPAALGQALGPDTVQQMSSSHRA